MAKSYRLQLFTELTTHVILTANGNVGGLLESRCDPMYGTSFKSTFIKTMQSPYCLKKLAPSDFPLSVCFCMHLQKSLLSILAFHFLLSGSDPKLNLGLFDKLKRQNWII